MATDPFFKAITNLDRSPVWSQRHNVPTKTAITALVPTANDIPKTSDEKIEAQVRNWVGQTFFGTLLKQMHDSPFKSELFSGGRGEDAFAPMLDARLAQHMAKGAGNKLVNAIVKKFKKNASERAAAEEYKKQTNPLENQKEATSDLTSIRA